MKKLILFLSIFSCTPAFAQVSDPTNELASTNLENPNALNGFFTELKARKDTPVHIIYIGDSHTAGDLISGSLRDELQNKFGNAGRGFFQAGYPFGGFGPQHLSISTNNAFDMKNSFPKAKSDAGPFGIGGYRARFKNSQKYEISADEAYKFNKIAVCANIAEDKSRLHFETLGKEGEIVWSDTKGQIGCKSTTLPIDAEKISFSAGAGSAIGLSNIGLWRENGGIVLSSFGIPGSQLSDFARRDFQSVATEIHALPPQLIILAYGTNEGFDDNIDFANYYALLKNQIENLKIIAPGADILIIGAPDANKKSIGAGASADCKPLDEDLSKKYPNIRYNELGAAFYPPPHLKTVRNAQRQLAKDMNIAFWDWQKAMGGECSANILSKLPEREIMGDRIHFSKIGARKIGKAIFDDLLIAFESQKGGEGAK